MDLKDILKKTRVKSEKVVVLRKPPSIAIDERPYFSKKTNDHISDSNQIIETNKRQIKDNNILNIETNRRQINDELSDLLISKTQQNAHIEIKKTQDKKKGKLDTFSSLIGLQREIVYQIYEECKISRSKVTKPLSIEHIAEHCNSTISSVKKSIQRLESKNIIIRVDYKLGRGGWTKYELPENIYSDIIHNEYNTKNKKFKKNNGDKIETLVDKKIAKSSVDTILKTDNFTENSISHEWSEINLSDLHSRNIHFGKSQINQLFKYLSKYSAFEFQESIDGFVYDIDHGHIKARRGYLNFLIGIIRNGGLYYSAHYVSPERKIILEQIKIIEDRKKEQAEYQQIQEDEKFQNWLSENYEKIYTLVDKQSTALGIDFKCGGTESRLWVRNHLYGKI